jgi:hypothetical protein
MLGDELKKNPIKMALKKATENLMGFATTTNVSENPLAAAFSKNLPKISLQPLETSYTPSK